jgi:hypothetical protein
MKNQNKAPHILTTRRTVDRTARCVVFVLTAIGCATTISRAGERLKAGGPLAPCSIEVEEKQTGWPVPLVELRTTHAVRFVTDNAGLIAFDLPELMGRETWFDVIGQGYEVPKDGFGNRGVRLTPQPGGKLRISVERRILARRLGRLTGAGLFAESQKLGLDRDWPESGVLGCDSVQNAVHASRLFWVWGDTTMARYPLGIFNGTGATTSTQPLNSFEPPVRLKFDYFRDDHSMPRGVATVPGEGPTWITGFASLPDARGQPHLVAAYMKVKPPLEVYQWGLAAWNGTNFETLRIIWTKSAELPKPPRVPEGHPVIWTNTGGEQWILFGNPFPTLKCPATFEAWQDPTQWQSLVPQSSVAAAGTNSVVQPHSGSIGWNPWLKRWVTVFMQRFGTPTAFGELWYAEADSPFGPWGPAVKILSHDHYTFYNPRLHPEFTPEDSPVLLFEGTYTIQFSDNHQPTPRYDYNQVLYRLDLDDPALAPARSR